MNKFTAALLVGAAVGVSTPAFGQATRTWVSGVGDDANPCSRTAPCKTFAGAISKTAAGGEINCLDPGGFGAVTINKSLTINCIYTEGGALAGGNGITINAGATDVVVLRGLDIFGVNPPTHGVRFVMGGALHIEHSTIRRFNSANSFGVSFAPSSAAQLFITDSTITQNGNAATGGGINIQPTGTGSARVTLRNVRIQDNANNGLRVDGSSMTTNANLNVTVEDAEISGNVNGVSTQSGNSILTVSVGNSVLVNNSGTGIISNGLSSSVVVGNTTIIGNGTGVSAINSAAIRSFGDNRLEANPNFAAPNDGTFTAPTLTKR